MQGGSCTVRVGLFGLPYSGKTTLFQLLTSGAQATSFRGASLAVGRVPDGRVDRLAAIRKPLKTTYTQIEFVDIPSWMPQGGQQKNGQLLQHLGDVDLLVHVVRAFDTPYAPHILGSVDPLRDAQAVAEELVLADWGLVETRLQNLRESRKKRPGHEQEVALLERFRACLEEGAPLSSLPLGEEEEALVRGYTFYTRKPMILALNVAEDVLPDPEDPGRKAVEAWCREHSTALVATSAQVEAELEALSPEERREFLADFGLDAPGLERLARTAYEHLGLLSYFTVGEKEVRAWTIRRGATAPEAARAIHSDIARGFIRAEVIAYDAYVAANGSMKDLREAGQVRLEGKDYVVQDGDIITFRFNV